ncbi:MAG: hypothetical protein HOV80_32480 [Polyangiaceae bacterium]|nr:hypothetical protein [Polyangiaceae bacterium]
MTTLLTRKNFVLGLVSGGATVAIGCGDDTGSGGSGGGTTTTTGGPGSTSGTGTTSSTKSSSSTTATNTVGTAQSTGTGMSQCTMMIIATISANHGHALEVPLADIDAGVDVTYDISGTAQHCHEVTITAADFQTLKDGGVVTKMTCNGTDHELVLSCAPGAPQPGTPDCSNDPNFGACG